MEIPRRVYDRLMSKVYEIEGGCLTAGTHLDRDGYTQVSWSIGQGRIRTTGGHRIVWTHEHGRIPSSMTVHHRCRTKRCLNGEHLRLLPNSENARRNWGRDWDAQGVCHRGHPDSDRGPSGACLPCAREKYHETKPPPKPPIEYYGECCKRGHPTAIYRRKKLGDGSYCVQCKRDLAKEKYHARKTLGAGLREGRSK